MGGSPNFDGMWTEQATASSFPNDAGRPALPASGAAFIPLLVQASPQGNAEKNESSDSEQPPALIIRFIEGQQTHTCRVALCAGLPLKYYLRKAGLISKRALLALNINGLKRVRISYVPKQGDVLNMVPPARPLLQLRES